VTAIAGPASYPTERPVTAVGDTGQRPPRRPGTVDDHRDAVERVIHAMRERLDEPLSLRDLSEIALFSPYHFDRMFRDVTGISPFRFLAALRMEAAKRLLLTTQLRVTDVCYEVGYNSLGTFTANFTQLVGLPPRSLRHLRLLLGETSVSTVVADSHRPARASSASPGGISGTVTAPSEFTGSVFVGAFRTPIPQTRPVRCALLEAPGPYEMPSMPDGSYHIFALGSPAFESLSAMLMPEAATLWVGAASQGLTAHNGRADAPGRIELRAWKATDPPMLVALPALLVERRARTT